MSATTPREAGDVAVDQMLAAFVAPPVAADLIDRIVRAAAAVPQTPPLPTAAPRSSRRRGGGWRRIVGGAIGASLLIGGAVAAAVGGFGVHLPRLADVPALLTGRPAVHRHLPAAVPAAPLPRPVVAVPISPPVPPATPAAAPIAPTVAARAEPIERARPVAPSAHAADRRQAAVTRERRHQPAGHRQHAESLPPARPHTADAPAAVDRVAELNRQQMGEIDRREAERAAAETRQRNAGPRSPGDGAVRVGERRAVAEAHSPRRAGEAHPGRHPGPLGRGHRGRL